MRHLLTVLTEDQMRQLDSAFASGGWTPRDVVTLMQPGFLPAILIMLREATEGARIAYQSELQKRVVAEEYREVALEQLFTESKTTEAGFSTKMRTRLLNAMHKRRKYDSGARIMVDDPLTTVGELIACSDRDLLRFDGVSKGVLSYVMAVLTSVHLTLREG